MSDFPECEQFRWFPSWFGICRHERLTPEKCDRWRIKHGLAPLNPDNATTVTPAHAIARSGQRRLVHGWAGRPPAGTKLGSVPAPPNEPVGNEFEKITHEDLGVEIDCAGCKATLAKMNQLGVQGCLDHFDELVAEVKQNVAAGKKQGKVTFWTTLWAALAVLKKCPQWLHNPADPIPDMLREAIRRTREKLERKGEA